MGRASCIVAEHAIQHLFVRFLVKKKKHEGKSTGRLFRQPGGGEQRHIGSIEDFHSHHVGSRVARQRKISTNNAQFVGFYRGGESGALCGPQEESGKTFQEEIQSQEKKGITGGKENKPLCLRRRKHCYARSPGASVHSRRGLGVGYCKQSRGRGKEEREKANTHLFSGPAVRGRKLGILW